MIISTSCRTLLLTVTLFLLTSVDFSLSYSIPHVPSQGTLLWNIRVFQFNGLIHWDLDIFSINGQSIAGQLKEAFPATMELCTLALGFVLIVGIPVGMIVGITRHKWQNNLISTIALLGFLIPVSWLALLSTLFCSLTLGWLLVPRRFDLLYEMKPITGFALVDIWLSNSPWQDGVVMSTIRHMILPVITPSAAPTTEVIRLMRINTIEMYDQSYVKTVATRDLSCFTILRHHVLCNVLPPVIPRLGSQFSTMLTLTIVTGVAFSWPDLEHWLINAIHRQDYATTPAGVVVCSSLVIIASVIFDILGVMASPLKHKEWYVLR